MPPLADLFGVCVLPETYTLACGSGCFSMLRIAGSTVDTVHSSVVGGFGLLFHTFQCEGGPRILRSFLAQTKYFFMSPSYFAVTGPVLPCEVYRILWILER